MTSETERQAGIVGKGVPQTWGDYRKGPSSHAHQLYFIGRQDTKKSFFGGTCCWMKWTFEYPGPKPHATL